MSLAYSGELLSGCCYRIQALFNITEFFAPLARPCTPSGENLSEASISRVSKFLPPADIMSLKPVGSWLEKPECAVPVAAPAKVHHLSQLLF